MKSSGCFRRSISPMGPLNSSSPSSWAQTPCTSDHASHLSNRCDFCKVMNSIVVCPHKLCLPSAWWTQWWSVYTNFAYLLRDELNGGLSTQTVPTFRVMNSMVVCLHKLCLPSAWWTQWWSVYTNCAYLLRDELSGGLSTQTVPRWTQWWSVYTNCAYLLRDELNGGLALFTLFQGGKEGVAVSIKTVSPLLTAWSIKARWTGAPASHKHRSTHL